MGNNKSIEMTSHSNRAECSFKNGLTVFLVSSVPAEICAGLSRRTECTEFTVHNFLSGRLSKECAKEILPALRPFQCLGLQGTYSPIAAKQLENSQLECLGYLLGCISTRSEAESERNKSLVVVL